MKTLEILIKTSLKRIKSIDAKIEGLIIDREELEELLQYFGITINNEFLLEVKEKINLDGPSMGEFKEI